MSLLFCTFRVRLATGPTVCDLDLLWMAANGGGRRTRTFCPSRAGNFHVQCHKTHVNQRAAEEEEKQRILWFSGAFLWLMCCWFAGHFVMAKQADGQGTEQHSALCFTAPSERKWSSPIYVIPCDSWFTIEVGGELPVRTNSLSTRFDN